MLCLLQPTRPLVPCHLGYSPSLWFSSFRVASSFCLVRQPNSRNQIMPCIKKTLARIWSKRAISQGSQKAILSTGLHHQNPKIRLQKAPGQDLAQKRRFLGIPECNFNCMAPSHQNPKIWLQKAPGHDLAQKGRFLGIPEGNFNYRAPPPESQNLAPKGSWPGFGPKGPFPRDPSRQFYLQGSKPPESQNLALKGSWPGFGPKGPFPRDPRRQF